MTVGKKQGLGGEKPIMSRGSPSRNVCKYSKRFDEVAVQVFAAGRVQKTEMERRTACERSEGVE